MQEIFISEEEIALLMRRWFECRSEKYRDRHVVDYGLELYLGDEGKQQLHEVLKNEISFKNIPEAMRKCFECRNGPEYVDAEPYLGVDIRHFAKILRDALSDHDFESFCSAMSKCFRCVPIGLNIHKYIKYQPLFDACDRISLKDGYFLDFVDVPAIREGTLGYTRKADSKPVPYIYKDPPRPSMKLMDPSEGYYKAFPPNECPCTVCFAFLPKDSIRIVFNGYKVASPKDEGNPFRDLEFEKSGSGFFQFAWFHNTIQGLMHSEYDPLEPANYVLTREHLDQILERIAGDGIDSGISTEDLALLRSIDLRPRVTMDGDSGEVVAVLFSLRGGFYHQHSHITWPNLMNRVETRKIVDYDCGLTSGPY